MYQTYFKICMAVTLINVRLWSELFHLLPLSKETKETMTMSALAIGLQCFWASQFQISQALDPGMAKAWNEIAATLKKGRSVFLLVNHVSKLDGLLMAMLAPVSILQKCKTLMMHRLFNAFLTGRIWKLCGHLPVYFKSDEHGKFSVDKERQAGVNTQLKEFLGKGRILIFCPEGQINKDPKTLQPFRRGSFAMPAEMGMDIWAFTTHNCDKVWPKDADMGGFPTTVKVTLTKLMDGDETKADTPEEIKAACVTMASKCQSRMQVVVDKYYATEQGDSKKSQ
uniref:Phospholipid/glycerol acyltransferase domain-containing protein n=1 Tax=Lotharella globosa TaxID=91324 RepID=A0A7S3YTW4_9EUKA|mmetsp:Transcript_5114/g.9958  ORF Transcript_5114/g.9958 Transcript_5114/m.9958 type:complete len:282 (+) Transcript_5114:26-871(+)